MRDTPRLRDGHRLLREAVSIASHLTPEVCDLVFSKDVLQLHSCFASAIANSSSRLLEAMITKQKFANGVEGAVGVVAVRENRYVAEHLVSSLYAQDRNYGTSPQPKSLLILRCSNRDFGKLRSALRLELAANATLRAVQLGP
jgi:hypothetical protein